MEDYRSNKQSVGESPKGQSVYDSQPEQSVGVLQSVGEASQYEKTVSATDCNKSI